MSTLKAYRRHNKLKCKATEGNAPCSNTRRPCPIWVRGVDPSGTYIERSLKDVQGKIIRDFALATKLLRDWEVEGAQPKTDVRATIESWREQYIANMEAENLASETVRKYKLLFRQLEDFAREHGHQYVNEFNVEVTTKFRLTWKDGWNSTAKKLERLRSIFNFAIEREWIDKNFAKAIKRPKPPKGADGEVLFVKPKPFSSDEMTRILAAAKTDARVYAFIVTMRATGLRVSDVTKLAVKNLKGTQLALYQTKTGEPISIALDEEDAEVLSSARKLNSNKEYFFQTGRAKLQSAVSNWRERISDVFERANIKDGHTHRFRHTFAAELLSKGVPMERVSKLLGHESIDVTQRHYAQWVKGRQDLLNQDIQAQHGWRKALESAQPQMLN